MAEETNNTQADDSIVIGIDTFNDKRTAYYFFTNLLGTQTDGRLSDNGRTSDATWDATWKAAAVKTSSGWSAEIAIPFSILKFEPGENKTWGLGIGRVYPRRIADIYGGIKTYGKSGGFEFTGMVVQAKPEEDINEGSANYAVLRLRQDVMKSSTIGFLVANKNLDGVNRGSFGLDTTLFFSEKVNFTGQFALSYGDCKSDNVAFFLRPSIDTSTFHFHIRYSHLGEKFADNANSVGFITSAPISHWNMS